MDNTQTVLSRWFPPVVILLSATPSLVGCGESASQKPPQATQPSEPSRIIEAQATAPNDDRDEAITRVSLRAGDPLPWDLMTLSNSKPIAEQRDQQGLERTVDILRASQWSETRGCPKTHRFYGGTSRDSHSLPDLPHTALSLQAICATGLSPKDPYIQRSVDFLSRCQKNIDTAHSPATANISEDGGFTLTPGRDGSGKRSSTEPAQQPYGTATCMAISSLLAAGVSPEDPRLQRAIQWLRGHYSLEVHPGMARGHEGLYRYYYEFAKAMKALRLNQLRDNHGVIHDWRTELVRKLEATQKSNGSWTNPEESSEQALCGPVTITCYALLTLDQIRESKRTHPHHPETESASPRKTAW